MSTLVSTGQLTISDLNDGLNISLSSEGMTLPADKNGVVVSGSYTGCLTIVSIFLGVINDSTNWSLSATPSSGVVGSFGTGGNLRTYSISSLTVDFGYVDLIATKVGQTSLTKRFSLTRIKTGADGTSITGTDGISSVIAYCASTTTYTSTIPTPTTGKTSLPAINSGGLTGTYVSAVPTLTNGQFLYVTDGSYNPATNTITWSIPYWSSLKVANLSAITVGVLGAITSGSIDIGTGSTSWHVDSSGNQWAGASTYAEAPYRVSYSGDTILKSLIVQTAGGTVILNAGGLQTGFEAPGTLNSLISIGSDGTLSNAGGGSVTLTGLGQKTYRVVASGSYATGVPISTGIYLTGSLMYAGSNTYRVTVINRSTGSILTSVAYDLYVTGQPAAMASALNALGSDKIVVVHSNGEPQGLRMTAGISTAIYRCGASRSVFGSPNVKLYSAYILVGIPGCGEGNGAEAYQGDTDNSTSAWCDIGFNILNGSLTGVSTSYTPRTLADYGYTGDLNASSDITLLSGGMTVTGNKVVKTGGTNGAWDAAVCSKNSFTGGAYCSAVAPDVGPYGIMFGLGTNALGSNGYELINYAVYVNGGYGFEVYENGVQAGLFGTCAAGDVISVLYDNASVSYMCNNVVKHTHRVKTHGQTLSLDSSFRGTGDSLAGVRFGPLANIYVPPRAGTGTTDNIVPDPQFLDLSWWNLDSYSAFGDWRGAGSSWKAGTSLYLQICPGLVDRYSEWFPTTPGATYRVEIQAEASSDFAGFVSILWHIPGQAFESMGQDTMDTWSDGIPIHYTAASPKGLRTYTRVLTLSSTSYQSRGQFRVKQQVTAGSVQFGSISITRMADAALIPPGAITDAALGLAPFTASIPGGGLYGSGPNGSRGYGSRTIVPSGGKAPYTYSWVDANQGNDTGTSQTIKLSNISTATVSAASSGYVSNNVIYCEAVGVITDAMGRTATASFYISQTHGTPP